MSRPATARLKDLCVDGGQYGLNISAGDYAAAGVRMLRTTDLGDDGSIRQHVDPVLVADVPEERYLLREGDLLLTRSGSVGRSFRVREVEAPTTFAGFLVRFRPRPTTDARFLAYVAASRPFQQAVEAEAVSSTIQNFNAERYAGVQVPNPPLDEQRRIANFLDIETARLDALASTRERQRGLLDLSEAALLAELSDSTAIRLPVKRVASRITSGPRGWGELADSRGDTAFLRITNVPRRGIELLTHDLLRLDAPPGPERERTRTREGDVLVTITADIGSVGIVRGPLADANVNQHIALVRPDSSKVRPEWLAWQLKAPRARELLTGSAYGGTKVGLSLSDVAGVAIPVPPLPVQSALLDGLNRRLRANGQLRQVISRQVEIVAERRQALITAAVTGQLDVTTARAGLS